jgi:hypothetical protein
VSREKGGHHNFSITRFEFDAIPTPLSQLSNPNYFFFRNLSIWRLFRTTARPGILLDENGKLKQVRYLEIRSIEDLYSAETHQILHEAIMFDEMMAKLKPKFDRKNQRAF